MTVIRHAQPSDLDALSTIEILSYPSSEAASRESISFRINAFPESLWIMEMDGEIVAFISAMSTDEYNLADEMYHSTDLYKKDGAWLMLFSVVTSPEHRSHGYASALLKQVIAETKAICRKGIVLTCKQKLLPFYGKFGFVSEGVSTSTHGSAVWYQMRLKF